MGLSVHRIMPVEQRIACSDQEMALMRALILRISGRERGQKYEGGLVNERRSRQLTNPVRVKASSRARSSVRPHFSDKQTFAHRSRLRKCANSEHRAHRALCRNSTLRNYSGRAAFRLGRHSRRMLSSSEYSGDSHDQIDGFEGVLHDHSPGTVNPWMRQTQAAAHRSAGVCRGSSHPRAKASISSTVH
jgi:hypothetical protein